MYYGNRPTVQPTVNTTPKYQTENVVSLKKEVLVDFAGANRPFKKERRKIQQPNSYGVCHTLHTVSMALLQLLSQQNQRNIQRQP